jgi:hypothetical protein
MSRLKFRHWVDKRACPSQAARNRKRPEPQPHRTRAKKKPTVLPVGLFKSFMKDVVGIVADPRLIDLGRCLM